MRAFFAVLLVIFVRAASGAESLPAFEAKPSVRMVSPQSGRIDSFVFSKLNQLGIKRAAVCSDTVFLRRVFLDVIGTLPTMDEAREFLDDKRPNKRTLLIDRLLARPEYADYWGMKWCDVLRVKSEFPVNLWPNAAQAYDRWIRDRIRENTPYSKFAWDLLTAEGSNFRSPAVNFYRSAGSKTPKAIARAVALAFMGERAEKWPEAKQGDMAVFFSRIGFKSTNEWKEEIVFFDGIDSTRKNPDEAMLPDGSTVKLSPDQDPRDVFARWLIQSKNSPFARNAVNRVWYWLLGRGIIHEPDDSRPDNPPCNPELLAWLSQEFVSANYDLKQFSRIILNSETYQLSCIPAAKQPKGEVYFASYPLRRVEAEVLIDAIDQITGATEEYSSMIPEPFTWVPTDKRSIALPDGSIGSSFLDLFGRPPRDTGLLAERNNKASDAQRLHLLNSNHIQSKLNKSEKLRAIFRTAGDPRNVANQLYLTILSRYPTDNEWKTIQNYSTSGEAKGAQVALDLAWALINSPEFLFRH